MKCQSLTFEFKDIPENFNQSLVMPQGYLAPGTTKASKTCLISMNLYRFSLSSYFVLTTLILAYLRNEFNFWNVHGIMNTSGLLQETRSIHDYMNR